VKRGWTASVVALVGVVPLVLPGAAMASGVTNAGDDLRTGWFPNEPGLTPQLVSGGSFGQLWSASVDGQVYAQPLLSPTGTLVVATENDSVYGLDPATGVQQWAASLAPTPWNPADIGCGDIAPSIGTTSTPVIDPSTKTVYLTHKTYASGSSGPAAWFMDALDVTNGSERAGFPVPLRGVADNSPGISFNPTTQQQRPGLLLMNGVVYAAFGSHCDNSPWEGWVFGVSTAGLVTARWVDNSTTRSGAGIWQSGVGLTSDRSGSILFISGNGASPTTPAPGSSPPANLGESIVRLQVQPNGSLTPVDFFTPFDAPQLDQSDVDFGSGGLVGLPDSYFGTPAVPHLAVAVGKQGYVYLVNRDSLGGYQQGGGGSDNVVQRIGPNGGVWGRPGVWPGDGGYVYIPTSTNGNTLDVYKYGLSGTGAPSLARVARSADAFGWGSGSPVITSNGTTSGSALVWIIWSSNRTGAGGQLRAYDPVPVGGRPVLRYSAPIGTATNYSTPGVGAGRIYVGTRDGTVLGFGSPVTQPLGGSGISFPQTTIGTSSQQTLTLTANRSLTVSGMVSSSGQFKLGNSTPSLPATLAAGQVINVPVTFSPTQTGVVGGQVDVATDAGTVSFSLSGTGQRNTAQLVASPTLLSLGGTAIGGHLSDTVTFSNLGATSLTISAISPSPSPPFSATNLPGTGATIGPGASITVDIAFDPTQVGAFTSAIGLISSGGNQTVSLSATAGTPSHLQISSENIDFGPTPVGTSATKTFTITNSGGTSLTITKSKPPFGGAFTATTSLQEGTTIAPGQTLTESVTFAPTGVGSAAGDWAITGDDGSGGHDVQFTGSGVAASAAGAPQGGSVAPVLAHHPAWPSVPKVIPNLVTTATIRGAYITYTATMARTARFTLQREIVVRRGARGCPPGTAPSRGQRCIRFVSVATFVHVDRVGVNRVRLSPRVPGLRLVPGTYRLRSVLVDTAGAKHTFYSLFRVISGRHSTVDPAESIGELLLAAVSGLLP
jgi:hypothetical protein